MPLTVYDETLRGLKEAVSNAKLGRDDKLHAIERLDRQARALELAASGPRFEDFVAHERAQSSAWGGRSVGRPQPAIKPSATQAKRPQLKGKGQLRLPGL